MNHHTKFEIDRTKAIFSRLQRDGSTDTNYRKASLLKNDECLKRQSELYKKYSDNARYVIQKIIKSLYKIFLV